MFLRKTGQPKMLQVIKAASVAINQGDAITFDASGYAIPATSASTAIIGVAKRAVKASDADYAQNTPFVVELFTVGDLYEVDTSTTATQAMVGTSRDLTNAYTLNVGAAGTVNQFRILGLGSTTTKAIVVCLKNALHI